VQVWKEALAQKQKAPYLRHFLTNGVVQDFHFCPYEVSALFPVPPPPHNHVFASPPAPAGTVA
jgi:hypothetical protein